MKSYLVYSHLIAACIAITILFMQDLALAKLRGRAMSAGAIAELKKSGSIVFYSLVALWVTGLALVALGYTDNPAYIMNQKLWAKFSVVCILTVNGIFLHYYCFPRLMSPDGFLRQSKGEQLAVVICASISVVSWLYSCYLGIARHWNNTAPYGYVMFIYAAVLCVVLVVAHEIWRGMRREAAYALR
jgi:hypothetical protein